MGGWSNSSSGGLQVLNLTMCLTLWHQAHLQAITSLLCACVWEISVLKFRAGLWYFYVFVKLSCVVEFILFWFIKLEVLNCGRNSARIELKLCMWLFQCFDRFCLLKVHFEFLLVYKVWCLKLQVETLSHFPMTFYKIQIENEQITQ